MTQHIGHLEIIGPGRLNAGDGIGQDAGGDGMLPDRFAPDFRVSVYFSTSSKAPRAEPTAAAALTTRPITRLSFTARPPRSGGPVRKGNPHIVEKDIAIAVRLQTSLDFEFAEADPFGIVGYINQGNALFSLFRIGLTNHAVKVGYAGIARKSFGPVDYPSIPSWTARV